VVRAFAVVAALVLVAIATLVVTGSRSGTGPATVRISLPVDPKSDIRVDLRNGPETVAGHADASGTVTFDTTVTPGTYDVVVTVDSPNGGAASTGGVDIGTARVVYRAKHLTLEEGTNTLDVDTLHATTSSN